MKRSNAESFRLSVHVAVVLVLFLAGCAAPIYKSDAIDETALETILPSQDLLLDTARGERFLTPGPDWLKGVDPGNQLIFLGVGSETGREFGLLLELDPDNDRLIYLPLQPGEDPLSALQTGDRRRQLEQRVRQWKTNKEVSHRELPLSRLSDYLVAPIPQPRHIYAVGANYPSHLFTDMSLPKRKKLIARLKQAKPRVFQKYPPVPAPGQPVEASVYSALPGPFASVAAPKQVLVPTLQGQSRLVPGHLDYEVEIAVLIGQDLSWDDVAEMDDRELLRAIQGYLLLSDVKVRDPQAVEKIIRAFREEKVAADNPYRIGVAALDEVLGIWDEQSCQWWSYAASWGRYASIGPFLAAAAEGQDMPARLIVSGRSYSASPQRPVAAPERVPTDRLLLRQATLTTTDQDYVDALIWDVPRIIRSLLDPEGNALMFAGRPPVLLAGDLVSLGTPGGTVISAKPWWLLPFAEDVLFWKGPEDFYDMFFEPTNGYYLHPGDELFFWGEGLGYQHLKIDAPGSGRGGSD